MDECHHNSKQEYLQSEVGVQLRARIYMAQTRDVISHGLVIHHLSPSREIEKLHDSSTISEKSLGLIGSMFAGA